MSEKKLGDELRVQAMAIAHQKAKVYVDDIMGQYHDKMKAAAAVGKFSVRVCRANDTDWDVRHIARKLFKSDYGLEYHVRSYGIDTLAWGTEETENDE